MWEGGASGRNRLAVPGAASGASGASGRNQLISPEPVKWGKWGKWQTSISGSRMHAHSTIILICYLDLRLFPVKQLYMQLQMIDRQINLLVYVYAH